MVAPRTKGRKVARPRGRSSTTEVPSRKVLRILREVKSRLVDVYGDGIRHVILFGSQARGDATPESDVDVAIVIRDDLNPREVERSLDQFLWDVVVDEGELIVTIAMNESKFRDAHSSCIMNIKSEGIII